MKALEWSEHHTAIFRPSREANYVVKSWTWSKFKLIQAFMHVLVTCKNVEDASKTEGAKMVTTLYIDFLDTQGQLTP